jgi:hypothetical protein
MKHRKADKHLERAKFLVKRINEINEWRSEAILHCEAPKHFAAVEARVLELREKAERSL